MISFASIWTNPSTSPTWSGISVQPRRTFELFKSQTGLTPNDYLQRLRIEKARELLRATRRSITAIALETASAPASISAPFSGATPASPPPPIARPIAPASPHAELLPHEGGRDSGISCPLQKITRMGLSGPALRLRA